MNWSIEEEKILESYLTGGMYSYHQLAKIMNRSHYSLRKKANELKLKNDKYAKIARYQVNHTFFKEINNKNSCWAGFIAADGHLNFKSKELAISLAGDEKYVLEQLVKDIEYTGKIFEYTYKFSSCVVRVGSLEILENLRDNFNICYNKTYRMSPPQFERLSDTLSFFVGYINGDGSISCHKRGKKDGLSLQVASASKASIEWIKYLLEETLNIGDYKPPNAKLKNKIVTNKSQSHFKFQLIGLKAALIVDFIRNNFSHIFLMPRKWSDPKVIAYIEEKKLQYPEKFKEFNTKTLAKLEFYK